MTDRPQAQQSPEATRRTAASPPAAPAATRSRPARPSRRKRFVLTLVAAAAGFVIVFQFLALQLQAGKDPALGGSVTAGSQSTHVASAPATSSSAPVVTRTSTGVQSVPASTTQAPVTPGAASKRGSTHHTIVTKASGSASPNGGQVDDLD